MPFRVTIEGDQRARNSLRGMAIQLHGREMVNAMARATVTLERSAKKNSPVDTGRLRSSISHAEFSTGFPSPKLVGIVGTNVTYAPFMEFGTGTFAGKSPHRPPASALSRWARRHGMNPFIVARAIFEKGGLEPRHYLSDALEENESKIAEILNTGVKTIIRKY